MLDFHASLFFWHCSIMAEQDEDDIMLVVLHGENGKPLTYQTKRDAYVPCKQLHEYIIGCHLHMDQISERVTIYHRDPVAIEIPRPVAANNVHVLSVN